MKLLDLTAPERSDIRYKRSWFPDGQPHFAIPEPECVALLEPAEKVEVICRIKSAADIVDVGLALDALFSAGRACKRSLYVVVSVAYMLGARMDRAIGPGQPFTLRLLADLLGQACRYVTGMRVLDPHSEKTIELLNRMAEPIHPDRLVKLALEHGPSGATIVIPDAGAVARTGQIIERLGLTNPVARCEKKRDSQTGNLSGFGLVEGDVAGKDCLIVDDLCDGGGTFAGIATVLRAAGARSVDLCVTHGIFSKGLRIPGIDRTFCTDSYGVADAGEYVAERGVFAAPHFTTYRRPGSVPPVLYVLTDFVRDHVRGLDER